MTIRAAGVQRAKEALDNEGSRSVPGLDLSLVSILIADRP